MSDSLEPGGDVSEGGQRPVALQRGASGVGKYLLFVDGLVGFVGGVAYGSLTFWFADRTGDPGSIIDERMFSPLMGILAAAPGAIIGLSCALAAWWAITMTRAAAGDKRYYLAAALGGAPVTALLSWLLLRNVTPVGFSIASGVGFVALTSTTSLLAAYLHVLISRRALGRRPATLTTPGRT